MVLTGITPSGLSILSSYVDKSGDVQSGALMTAAVVKLGGQYGAVTRTLLSDTNFNRWCDSLPNMAEAEETIRLFLG